MYTQLSFLDKKTSSFLESVKVGSIKKLESELITIKDNDTIEEAFKKLSIHAISSAPVFDTNHQMIGSISVLDLTFWIVRTYSVIKGDKQVYDYDFLAEQFKTPISEILQCGVEAFWPVNDENTVAFLINSFFKWGVHRAPVSSNNKIIGHVSQSDVIAFLAKNIHSLGPIVKMTMKELGLDVGKVYSVTKDKLLIEVFSGIVESKFTGLAVVDEKGRLINNISASDLKGVTKDTFWKLNMPISKVLGSKPPLTCTPDSTLKSVIQKLYETKVHRIYVVDAKYKPLNVITLTTIMKVFSPKGSECFG